MMMTCFDLSDCKEMWKNIFEKIPSFLTYAVIDHYVSIYFLTTIVFCQSFTSFKKITLSYFLSNSTQKNVFHNLQIKVQKAIQGTHYRPPNVHVAWDTSPMVYRK